MPGAIPQNPFQWLQDLERRAKQKAKGLPRQEKIQQIWRGVAFRLGENYLVTSLLEIREVLHYPRSLARVPGAKMWIKGMANLRGLLLPIVDLQACLEGKPITLSNRSRVIVINQVTAKATIYAGLLVDEVLGIKHFPESLRDLETPCKHAWLAPFAKGIFIHEETLWTVIDTHTLAESETFLNAAL